MKKETIEFVMDNLLTRKEREFLAKANRGEIKLAFGDRDQLAIIKSINDKVNLDKEKVEDIIKDLEKNLDDIDDQIRDLENEKDDIEDDIESYEKILEELEEEDI